MENCKYCGEKLEVEKKEKNYIYLKCNNDKCKTKFKVKKCQ